MPNSTANTSRSLVAHNATVNRFLITGKLTLVDALHVGSGRGDATTDALVVAYDGGAPFIPGSSLRGVLRAAAERLLAALNAGGATTYWACGLYETRPTDNRICVGNLTHEASKAAYDGLLEEEERGRDAAWAKLPDHLCDACRLFGAGSFWASPLRFTDLKLDGKHHTQIRHGVGIHRDTGTAANAIKYDRQVVDPGAVFIFEATAENLDNVDLALLALALKPLLDGEIALGGSTGRGLGRVQLTDGWVYSVDMKNPEELKAYLLAAPGSDRKFPASMGLADFIDQHLKNLFTA